MKKKTWKIVKDYSRMKKRLKYKTAGGKED